LKNMSESPVTD